MAEAVIFLMDLPRLGAGWRRGGLENQPQSLFFYHRRRNAFENLTIHSFSAAKPAGDAATFVLGNEHFMRKRFAEENDHLAKTWVNFGQYRVAPWLEKQEFAAIVALPVFIQVVHRRKYAVFLPGQDVRVFCIAAAGFVDGVMTFVIKQTKEEGGIQPLAQGFHPGEIGLVGAVGVVQPADDVATDVVDLFFGRASADVGGLET